MALEIELVKQRFLHHRPFAHHRQVPRSPRGLNQDLVIQATPNLSTKSANDGRCDRCDPVYFLVYLRRPLPTFSAPKTSPAASAATPSPPDLSSIGFGRGMKDLTVPSLAL